MVVTQTPAEGDPDPYPVLRRPSLGKLLAAIRWADVFWQNNLSLRTIWPAMLVRKPIVITHQGSYCRAPAGIDLVQRVKHAVVRRFPSVAISRAVAACFAQNSTVIPNPYGAREFSEALDQGQRSLELIFVGRLVSEKGVDLLLEALALLHRRGCKPRLSIVGSGPLADDLEALTAKLELSDQVRFAGPKRGVELAELLQQHQIMVVPSRYDEPFGVVALEGIASGCVVVGSSGGGLPEAIGPCGVTFPNGDVAALAQTLETLLAQPNEQRRLLAAAPAHLAKFHPATIADSYLSVFRSQLA